MAGERLKHRANCFIAAAGASSVLAGLVTVVLSVHVKKDHHYPHLPARGDAAIAMFVSVPVSSWIGLVEILR